MKAWIALPLLVVGAAVPARAHSHKAPPVEPATSYANVEVHQQEKVAIAAEPYDTGEKESIFRVDYLRHGILPIRLIVTNLGNRPISLRDARIFFETPAGDMIQAAEPEDVERTMTSKERMGERIPLPAPLPSIRRKPKGSDKQIEADFDQFEYQALVVEPHSTQAGFLWYDVSQLNNPLVGSKLYIKELRNADGHQLFYFEISFDKYLKSKSAQMK